MPAETYFITRRCSQRALRLRPCAETNQIFMYCLALAALKTGVRLHAACVMSNHHHLVVTDPHGVVPNFLRELHRLTAKAMNALQGQWENLWAAEPCNVVRLVTDEDVDDKIAYVVANPVTAGLVKDVDDWPGFLAWGDQTLRVVRPSSYFKERGTCPSELTLSFEPPPVRDTESGSRRDWRTPIALAISARVAAARRAVLSRGQAFLGRAAILAASFVQQARSHEQRFGVIPTFAARLSSVRDRLRDVERHFRVQYRAALERWRNGEHDVRFPFGAWGVVVFHGACIAPPLAG